MAEPFYAEIRLMPYSYAPRGWASCEGQLLQISQNTALFSLVGTMYGGDGRTTFGLPDLRHRAPMHSGRGPGLTQRLLSARGGYTKIVLNEFQIPSHTHNLQVSRGTRPEFDTPRSDALPHVLDAGGAQFSYKQDPDSSKNVQMSTLALQDSGGSGYHENMQPYLGMNYCIALYGLYPSRS